MYLLRAVYVYGTLSLSHIFFAYDPNDHVLRQRPMLPVRHETNLSVPRWGEVLEVLVTFAKNARVHSGTLVCMAP